LRRARVIDRKPFSRDLTGIRNHGLGEEFPVALKIELKPDERIILGDCIVTNADRRTRLVIEGKVPILREKDVMTPKRANTPAKRLYLVVQNMYTSRRPEDHYAAYLQLVRDIVRAFPATWACIDRINNRILTGELYKALKEARKLITYEEEAREMNHASKAYTKVARETANPRDLEASLLLKAAAKLQAVQDSWKDRRPQALDEALLYNRRLWTVFIDSVTRDDNKLPFAVRKNLTQLGMFVMGETFSLMTEPKPEHLTSIIKVNRGIAAGLRGKA
jgi:flagellar biosynthesis repressor protein FlbT